MAASEDSPVSASHAPRYPLVTIAEDSDGTKVWLREPSGRNTRYTESGRTQSASAPALYGLPTILSEWWSADANAFLVVATSVGDPLIAAEWKKSRPWSNAMTTITTARNRSTD